MFQKKILHLKTQQNLYVFADFVGFCFLKFNTSFIFKVYACLKEKLFMICLSWSYILVL